jgi:hypothetical protein
MTPRTDADRDVPPERDGDPIEEVRQELGGEGFGELVRYTAAGYVGGVVLGGVLDALGFQRSAVGQWLVRTLAGEGESVMEGVYALRRRLAERGASLAEAYGWGKLIGMTVPWWIDWGSRLLGVNVYGVEAFYIPYFYAMSDQIGGNVSGLLFLRRRDGSHPGVFSPPRDANGVGRRAGSACRAPRRAPPGLQPQHPGAHSARDDGRQPLLAAPGGGLVVGAGSPAAVRHRRNTRGF